MDIWAILGIEPTEETAKIKKAYAQQLKKYHPEDNPEGFQKLREAYDWALKFAKHFKDNTVIPFPTNEIADLLSVQPLTEIRETRIETGSDQTPEVQSSSEFNITDDDTPNLGNVQDLKGQFLHEVEQLYQDFFARIDLENWQRLFDCDLMWNIDRRCEISDKLLGFFSGHHHLPQNIWKYLDDCFHWSQQSTYDSQAGPIIEFITRQIIHPSIPDYSRLKKFEGFDYDKFLDSREIALNTTEIVNYYIDHVEEVYPDDPRWPVFWGKFFIRIKDFVQAKEYLEKAMPLNPTDTELSDLYELVNPRVKTQLFRDLVKRPWKLDLLKQYLQISREIKEQAKTPQTRKFNKSTSVVITIGLVAIVLGIYFSGRKNVTVDPVATMENSDPIEVTETNLERLPQLQKVTVRFDRIRYLNLGSDDIPNADNGYDPMLVNDYVISYESGKPKIVLPRVAIGKLQQKEIIFIDNATNTDQDDKTDSRLISGVIFDQPSSMLNTVENELLKESVPLDVAPNLVATKYIITYDNQNQMKAIFNSAKSSSSKPDSMPIMIGIFLGIGFLWYVGYISLKKR